MGTLPSGLARGRGGRCSKKGTRALEAKSAPLLHFPMPQATQPYPYVGVGAVGWGMAWLPSGIAVHPPLSPSPTEDYWWRTKDH